MSGKVRIPFVFHVKKVECVSLEEAARIRSRGPASGLRLGPNDQWSPIDMELHASPVLDRLMKKAWRQYARKREMENNRADPPCFGERGVSAARLGASLGWIGSPVKYGRTAERFRPLENGQVLKIVV